MLRIYFPVVGLEDKPNLLMEVHVLKDMAPGLYFNKKPVDITSFEKKAAQTLSRLCENVALNISPYGAEVTSKELGGDSMYGAASLVANYDCDQARGEQRVAISMTPPECSGASSIEDKLQICEELGMLCLIVKRDNEKEIPEAMRMPLEEASFSAEGAKFQVWLAGKDWQEQLARLFGLEKRRDEKASPTHTEVKGPQFYELYLAALFPEDSDAKHAFAKVFQQAGPPYNKPLQEKTFAHKALFPDDEAHSPNMLFFGGKEKTQPHVILCGPTSTGKTAVAHAFLLNALMNGKKAVYISPTRALVYEVYEEFLKLFRSMRDEAHKDEKNGMLFDQLFPGVLERDLVCSTGERSEQDGQILRSDYRIIFSVYEKANIFMNLMLDNPEDKTPALVVIDELHMLLNEERGGILDMFIAKSQDMKKGPARIVGITTENDGADILCGFLSPDDAPAMHRKGRNVVKLEMPDRPVPVTHYLQLGDRREKIMELSSSEIPALSREARGAILNRLLGPGQEPSNVAPSQGARYSGATEAGEQDLEYGANEFNFENLLKDTEHKKVLVIFKSIETIYNILQKLVAARLKDSAEDWEESVDWEKYNSSDCLCPVDTLKKIHAQLKSSFVTDEERENLWKGAQAGIFVYFSPMDYWLREAMADAFKEKSDKKQILLATNALAYGVNLPADAVWLTSIRDVNEGLISSNEFFNILGRAGRLGKSAEDITPCAYVLPCVDGAVTSFRDELGEALRYYGDRNDDFHVRTISETDLDKVYKDTLNQLSDVHDATFRSALDALRFVNKKNEIDEIGGTNPYHVREHFQHSVFGWGNIRQRDDRTSFDNFLETVYNVISDASSFSENKLVNKRKDANGNTTFVCTELASALIDTGTKWKAIEPMTAWLQTIMPLASSLPVELILVGILSVQELWDVVRRFDQQSRKVDIRAISDDSRKFAERSLADEIDRLPAHVETDRILGLIDSFLENNCQHLQLRDKRQRGSSLSPEARRNSFYRLLAAFLRWARGANANEIKELAAPEKGRQDFSRGFSQAYGDKASWLCVLCLRFFSKTKSQLLDTRHESTLQNLALRMRYGVPQECVPFMGLGKERQKRSDIMRYREEYGLTPKIVLQNTYEAYVKMWDAAQQHRSKPIQYAPSDIYDTLQENAESYYCREAKEFCDILALGSAIAPEHWKAIKNYFEKPKSVSNEKLLYLLRNLVHKDFSVDIRPGKGLTINERHSHGKPLFLEVLDASADVPSQCEFLQNHLRELRNKSLERLCTWHPWKRSTHAGPQHPTISLIATVFLLRMLEEFRHLEDVHDWLSRQKNSKEYIFRIQELISTGENGIRDLRNSMAGAILQGALQLAEPVFDESDQGGNER